MRSDIISNLIFRDISCLQQFWRNERYFEYITVPRPYHGLCFILDGSIRYKTAAAEFTAKKGDIVIINKNSNYKAIFSRDPFAKNILINFQCRLPDSDDEFTLSESEITVLSGRFDLEKNFKTIADYFCVPGRECIVKSEFFCIFDKLTAVKNKNTVLKGIENALSSDAVFYLTESEAAEKCSVSVSTFQRQFKKNYGKNFSEYKNELKISRAKELLISGEYSVTEISEKLSFCDSAYFSRFFKNSTGLSPREFIKRFYAM